MGARESPAVPVEHASRALPPGALRERLRRRGRHQGARRRRAGACVVCQNARSRTRPQRVRVRARSVRGARFEASGPGYTACFIACLRSRMKRDHFLNNLSGVPSCDRPCVESGLGPSFRLVISASFAVPLGFLLKNACLCRIRPEGFDLDADCVSSHLVRAVDTSQQTRDDLLPRLQKPRPSPSQLGPMSALCRQRATIVASANYNMMQPNMQRGELSGVLSAGGGGRTESMLSFSLRRCLLACCARTHEPTAGWRMRPLAVMIATTTAIIQAVVEGVCSGLSADPGRGNRLCVCHIAHTRTRLPSHGTISPRFDQSDGRRGGQHAKLVDSRGIRGR